MRCLLTVLLLALFLCPTGVLADEKTSAEQPPKPLTNEQAADAVLEAIKAKDDAALKAVAGRGDPDPWFVADELIRRGAFDAADAFAKASPQKLAEKLPAYVASQRGTSDDPSRRARAAAGNAALEAGKPQEALEAYGPPEKAPPVDVLGNWLLAGRANALRELNRPGESAAAFLVAADAAERLGWPDRTWRALYQGGQSALAASDVPQALAAWQRCLQIVKALDLKPIEALVLGDLGNGCQQLGDFAKALSFYEQALATKEVLGDKLAVASALQCIGAMQAELGRHADALETLGRALAAMEVLGNQGEMAWTLWVIGSLHYDRGDWAKALSADERVLAVNEALGNKAGAAAALTRIGIEHFRLDHIAEAETIDERAIAAHEALGDKGGAAAALGNLALVYAAQMDFAKALATHERALAVKEALGDHGGAAATRSNIGLTLLALGDKEKALSSFERALAGFEALGDKLSAARTLDLLGAVQAMQGDHVRALATNGRAQSVWEAIGRPAEAAASMARIGEIHTGRAEYARALVALQRALAVQEGLGDRRGAAGTLLGIGVVYTYTGDYAKALAADERALAVQEEVGDAVAAGKTMCNIGVVYHCLGDLRKALAQYERALAAQEAVGDKESIATTLGNMATLLAELGEQDRALSIATRARVTNEALGRPSHAAGNLLAVGRVHEARGEFERALAAYEQSRTELESGGDRRVAVEALIDIGRTQAKLGKVAAAIQTLERAVRSAEKLGANAELVKALQELASVRLDSGAAGRAISDAHRAVLLLKTLVAGLGEEQGATARGQYTGLFATGLRAAAQAEDVGEAAFFLESGRAGSLLESLGMRHGIRRASLPEELRLAESRARIAESLALVAYTKSLEGGNLKTIRARDAELKVARAGTQEVVERIQRDAKREAQLWYPVATPFEDIQDLLAPEEALVLYGLAPKDGSALALVLTKAEARVVPLGKSSDVRAACEALDASDPGVDPAPALERLRELVVRPLALAKETKRVLVSPEGALSYVPFSALLPGMDVAYESSGTTYGVLREDRSAPGTQVLALGDADYTAKFNPTSGELYASAALADAGPTRGAGLSPLPGTRAEAVAVGDVRLFAKDASEAGLAAALAAKSGRWHAVHFACHGLVDPDRPTLSSLALTPDAENDGFLTALEVLRMLIPSDLVVLSACETGRGKIAAGEGIVGLTRAFMFAGTPRVICSLWKVDDEATQALMIKFYELWNPKDGTKGLGAAAALKRAQAFIRDHPDHPTWKHPYYWAAWVLWGLPD